MSLEAERILGGEELQILGVKFGRVQVPSLLSLQCQSDNFDSSSKMLISVHAFDFIVFLDYSKRHLVNKVINQVTIASKI